MKPFPPTSNLQAVQKQFEQWRNQKRSRREPIPEELWESVISLSSQYGRGHLCKTLGLNSSALKSRLENYGSISKQQESNHFVEVRLNPADESGAICSKIEVERPDGSRMRIHFQEGVNMPIPSLIHSFLG